MTSTEKTITADDATVPSTDATREDDSRLYCHRRKIRSRLNILLVYDRFMGVANSPDKSFVDPFSL